MTIVLILCFLAWIYLLSVFKRGKMTFWYFLFGSVGTFIFMLVWLEPVLTVPLTDGVAVIAGFLGDATKFYKSYFE
jgi:hypothetical protein